MSSLHKTLRDTERRLVLAQSAAHVRVWKRDLRTNVGTISREYASLYGLPPQASQLSYQEWLDLTHPDDRERVQALTQETLERTQLWDCEFRVVWPDGIVHWLLGKGSVLLDNSNQPVCLAGITLDIPERKRAEELRSLIRLLFSGRSFSSKFNFCNKLLCYSSVLQTLTVSSTLGFGASR